MKLFARVATSCKRGVDGRGGKFESRASSLARSHFRESPAITSSINEGGCSCLHLRLR